MKKLAMILLAIAFAMPAIAITGCDTPTAQEKEWEKNIPKVPPADKSKSRMPTQPT